LPQKIKVGPPSQSVRLCLTPTAAEIHESRRFFFRFADVAAANRISFCYYLVPNAFLSCLTFIWIFVCCPLFGFYRRNSLNRIFPSLELHLVLETIVDFTIICFFGKNNLLYIYPNVKLIFFGLFKILNFEIIFFLILYMTYKEYKYKCSLKGVLYFE